MVSEMFKYIGEMHI